MRHRPTLSDDDRRLLAAFEARGATEPLNDAEALLLLEDLRERLGILDPPDPEDPAAAAPEPVPDGGAP